MRPPAPGRTSRPVLSPALNRLACQVLCAVLVPVKDMCKRKGGTNSWLRSTTSDYVTSARARLRTSCLLTPAVGMLTYAWCFAWKDCVRGLHFKPNLLYPSCRYRYATLSLPINPALSVTSFAEAVASSTTAKLTHSNTNPTAGWVGCSHEILRPTLLPRVWGRTEGLTLLRRKFREIWISSVV